MPTERSLPGEITALLQRWKEGDREALEALAAVAYERLHAIAGAYLRRENREHTLQATALVNELYLRLARQRGADFADREHFYTLAAMMMRRILTDYARQSHASKRPGADSVRVPLHEDLAWVDAAGDEILDLDRALDQLESVDPRSARLLELRFFLGCNNDEAAEILSVSRTTIDRDLRYAKAWLHRWLCGKPAPTVT